MKLVSGQILMENNMEKMIYPMVPPYHFFFGLCFAVLGEFLLQMRSNSQFIIFGAQKSKILL